MVRLLCAAAAAAATAAAAPPPLPKTFGAGLPAPFVPVCGTPTTILNHTLATDSSVGVLTHFWTTGDVDSNVLVEIFMDGEPEPSIAFEPSMACGQGFPGDMGTDPVSVGGLFAAGDKMGKAGAVGGWYFKYRIPFQRSVFVQIRQIVPPPSGDCQHAYVILRGFEGDAGFAGVTLPSGFTLPLAARLHLQSIDNATFPALSLVAVANVSSGYAALLLQSTMALSTRPAGNNYIEGCWHLLRTAGEGYPGLIVGTGFEDMYNSAYWFGAASGYPNGILFQHADSGLLHFSRPSNTERLSAYRFFDSEVVGMVDGGRLMWRVGDEAGKCTSNGTVMIIGTPSAVHVKAYTWLYVWPNGGPITPLPPLIQLTHITYGCNAGTRTCELIANASGPFLFADCDGSCGRVPTPTPQPGPPAIVGCSDGECDAFCDVSSSVHGCAATWSGALSLRAAGSGVPCGNALGVPCAAPADACAPGWALCLSYNASSKSGGDTNASAFRAGITAAACAAATEDPRVFVAAMSHARPEWSSLPPAPCPPAPIDDDNGCAASGSWGGEPVCCGAGCGVPSCPNALWMGGTRIHAREGEACGALTSDWADGVLCCRAAA